MNRVILQAHRGVSTEYPENTMSAFRAAVAQGYGIIELDPKFTSDDHCVILHDSTVNRTGRRRDGAPLPDSLPISALTLNEARELEFGGWFSPVFSGEPLPLLGDALSLSRETGVPLKIDNVIERFTESQRALLFGEIRQAGLADHIGITCSTIGFARRAVEALPRATIHYDGFVDEETLETIKGALADNDLCVWLRFDNRMTSWNRNPPATRELARLVHRFAKLGVWILSERQEYDRAVGELGADIIETTGALKPER